ncbi:MAG: pirin family protein [Pseudomonadales bacterium]|nr:pirin family protein [Pseudomonadales bacterium]
MSNTTSNTPGKHSGASDGSRALLREVAGTATADGAGVKLTRLIGSPQLDMVDPFLLLDCFASDEAQDYIGGFPTHPHRGFETVTYLLHGRMRHRDSTGREGVIESGGVQWMTAGRGILHSEMPEQERGLLQGFQLWVNLPAAAKMTAPHYQEYPPAEIPLEQRENGSEVRVIAGTTNNGTVGPVVNHHTDPLFIDVTLPAGAEFVQATPVAHTALLYVIEGALQVVANSSPASAALAAARLGVLGQGDQLAVRAGKQRTRFLLIAGRPLHESVVRAGPFVMNTREEIMQAFKDFSGEG